MHFAWPAQGTFKVNPHHGRYALKSKGFLGRVAFLELELEDDFAWFVAGAVLLKHVFEM